MDRKESNSEEMKKVKSELSQHRPVRIKIYLMLLYLISIVAYIYIITPIALLLELILLFSTPVIEFGSSTVPTPDIFGILNPIGIIVIFAVPLVPFFMHGIKIIALQDSLLGYFWTTIVTLLESVIGIPLTFLYKQNLYSIYLYKEKGFEQTLNPWIIFYPTTFIRSYVELVRLALVSLYFIFYAGFVYGEIGSNTFNTFEFSVCLGIIVTNVLRLIALIGILLFTLLIHNKKFKKSEVDQNKDTKQKNGQVSNEESTPTKF